MSLIEQITKKRKQSLVGRFTFVIGISILMTLFFVSGFNIYSSFAVINQYDNDNNVYSDSLVNSIYENAKQDLKDKHFNNVSYMANQLIKNNLIMFVGIIDNKSKKYVWSSIKEIIGTRAEIGNPRVNVIYDKNFRQINPENIKEISKTYDDYTIVTDLYNNNTLGKLVEIVLKGNFFLLVNFIVFGFLIAWILARSLTKPIHELAHVAEEFSKGNLSHRSNISSYEEIGKLASSFNEMAEKLDNLYSSLEQQVKERTNELIIKNNQLEQAYVDIKEAQSLLVHNEKMSSLGQLTAGLAHELNNPINFIYGNLSHFKNYSGDLVKIIQVYEEISANLSGENLEKVNHVREDLEYDFILEDLPALIKSCQDGAERCKQIILDLKNFSRLDEAVVKEVDLHEGINSTLNILHNKIKNKVTVHKEYGDIPKLSCYAGQLNQVFMNIIDNAVQAIKVKGDVYIRTCTENNNIVIIIEDNGFGIQKNNLSKIFDPFFTTKPVGEGTGLGLSITYKIIKKHNGNVVVESEEGKGTKFILTFPLNWTDNMNENENIIQENSNL